MFILSVRNVFIIFKKYCSNFKFDNSFIKLLIKSIQIIMARSIDFLFYNLSKIFSSLKKILVFILVLPVTYYIIKIQIFVVIFFVLFYFSTFIIFHVFLKSNRIMTCVSIYGDDKRQTVSTIVRVLIFIPRAKAYLLVYTLLSFFYDREKSYLQNYSLLEFFILLIIIFTISILLNLSLILVFGYSYLAITVASRFVVKFFNVIHGTTYNMIYDDPYYMYVLYNNILVICVCGASEST